MNACGEAAEKAGMRGNLARGLAGVSPNASSALQENIELFKKWDGAGDGRFKVMLGKFPNQFSIDYNITMFMDFSILI